MKTLWKRGFGLSRKRRNLLLGVLWLAAVAGVGVPAWLTAVRQHGEVKEVEVRIAELDRWNVAGKWLARSLAQRQAAVDSRWEILFPSERRRGELFLDLARIADRSGVEGFELGEITSDEIALSPAAAGGDMDDDMDQPAPLVELNAYRVKAHFRGRYEQVARFIGGLHEIKRSVSVHDLDIRPVRDAVTVELELDVHVSKSARS